MKAPRTISGALVACLSAIAVARAEGLAPAPDVAASAASPASREVLPHADSAVPSLTPATPGAAVIVQLTNRSREVSDGAFYQALAAALGRPLLVATGAAPEPGTAQLAVSYDPVTRELSVSYVAPDVGALTRIVEAPANAAEVPEIAALIAANLATRQVAALAPIHTQPAPETVTAPLPPVVAPAVAPEVKAKRPERFASASFFYPLATNYGLPDIKTHLDLSILFGLVGELEGVGVGTLNAVHGQVRGLQLGVLANLTGPLVGLQIAGGVDSARTVLSGVQVAGAVAHSAGMTRGAQLAAAVNFSLGDLSGLQVAGLLNYAGDVSGAQIGILNIAGKVRGVQLGVVNISKDIQGVPIGVASISKTGGVHVAAWASSQTLANIGLRLATRYTYTMITMGYHATSTTKALGPGMLIGVRIPTIPKLAVDVDVGGEYLLGTRLCCYETNTVERLAHAKDRQRYRLRVLPTWIATPWLSVFGGAGVVANVPFAVYSGFSRSDRTITVKPEVLLGVSL